MPEALSFCLARAQRPLLHVDKNAHLHNNPSVLSFIPDQQLLSQAARAINSSCSDGPSTAGVTPRLELVKDKSILYLGETCVFYITLSNQGSSAASAITVKVECSVEGGSNAVLYDNSQSPLPQLPATGRHDVIVQTDIKEQGVITIVASAVYTDRYGERKYHVQFFKFQSASPLSVKTRVRCLPHVQQPPRLVLSSSSSIGSQQQQQQQLGASATATSSSSRPYCFLEVSVENATLLPLVLHAVKLLPSSGLAAQELSISDQQAQQQQQQQGYDHSQRQQQQQQMVLQGDLQRQQHQGVAAAAKRVSAGSSKLEPAGSDSDTKLQHDIGDSHNSSSSSSAASAASASGPDLQHQQQQQQQMPYADSALQQQQKHHQQHQQQPSLGPLLSGQPPLVVIPPGGGSHNYLWQIEQQRSHRSSSSDGGGAVVGSSSTSSAFLGRLELHWSTFDGKTGTLLTQPLSRPISTAAGKDVFLQLTQLLPLSAAAAKDPQQQQQQQQQQFLDHLEVGVAVRAVFSLTAAAGQQQQQQQAGTGPLLVLYTELSSSGSSSGAAAAAGSLARISDSSSSGQQQQQLAGPPTAAAAGAGTQQQRRPGSSGVDSGRGPPAVAVQGKRSQRIQRVLASQSVSVEFVLVPLKRGWVRLPTFVVVSEADGRLLDSVHYVHVLVV